MVNEISGKVAMLSQLISAFPLGFGSFSHSFNTRKLVINFRPDICIKFFDVQFGGKNYLINVFENFVLFFLFLKLYLDPENSHLTESTENTLITW